MEIVSNSYFAPYSPLHSSCNVYQLSYSLILCKGLEQFHWSDLHIIHKTALVSYIFLPEGRSGLGMPSLQLSHHSCSSQYYHSARLQFRYISSIQESSWGETYRAKWLSPLGRDEHQAGYHSSCFPAKRDPVFGKDSLDKTGSPSNQSPVLHSQKASKGKLQLSAFTFTHCLTSPASLPGDQSCNMQWASTGSRRSFPWVAT